MKRFHGAELTKRTTGVRVVGRKGELNVSRLQSGQSFLRLARPEALHTSAADWSTETI